MKGPAKDWTHEALTADLAFTLRQVGSFDVGPWVTATEVGFGGRRFDLVAVGVQDSKPDLRVYEVKVSQTDLARELASGKWNDAIAAGASVYLAVPNSLKLKRADLPRKLGLCRRRESGWSHEIKQPARNPVKSPLLLLATLAAMRRQFVKTDEKIQRMSVGYIADWTGPETEAIPPEVRRAAQLAGKNLNRLLGDLDYQRQTNENHAASLAQRAESLSKREAEFAAADARTAAIAALDKLLARGMSLDDMQRVARLVDGFHRTTEVWRALVRLGLDAETGSTEFEDRALGVSVPKLPAS